MTSRQKVDLSEYHSLLTYHGIFPTGLLSESDLDYLVFRLKIFSTSLDTDPVNPSSSSSLFELVRTPPTKSDHLIPQPLSAVDWNMPGRSTDPLRLHVCDFHDDLSPCWSRQCELWEGIHSDHQSRMWHEYNTYFSDLAIGAARLDGVEGVSPVDQAEASAHTQRRHQGVRASS